MPRSSDYKVIAAWIDDIADDKLENFATSEKTIDSNDDLGMRLDHQGVRQTRPQTEDPPWVANQC